MKDKTKKREHKDTTISLHPLSFDKAIKELSQTTKHGDSEAEESGNTTKHAPESGSSKKQTSPHRESSDD